MISGFQTVPGEMENKKDCKPNERLEGIIIKILLKRFMCFEEFKWFPNSNVNLMAGAGEHAGVDSALQGLRFGLLPRNYNINLPDYIQKGSTNAGIEVTLKNDGEDAYQPTLYGSAITLQTTISKTAYAFQIKNHKGDVVLKSTREANEERNKILDHFRIFPDASLPQPVEKVESPADLYSYFHCASALERRVDQIARSVARGDCVNREIEEFLFARKTFSNIFERRFVIVMSDFSKMFGCEECVHIKINHKKRELRFFCENFEINRMD